MIFSYHKKKKSENGLFGWEDGKSNYGRLPSAQHAYWVEENFTGEAKGRSVLGRTFNPARTPYYLGIAGALLFLLVGKTAWLQIVKGEYYYDMAEGNRIRIERLEAKRGIIYDRDLKPLVRNVANFVLYLVPGDLPKDEQEREEIFSELAAIAPDEIKEARLWLENNSTDPLLLYQPLFIADDFSYEQAISLILKAEEWPGVVLTSKTRREYDLKCLSLSHILGYTGMISESELALLKEEYLPIDYIGKMGIEYFWESELKGKNGRKQIEVDALGKEEKILGQETGRDGFNLVIAINTAMQIKLEDLLTDYLSRHRLNRASGIVLDPDNGEILALVSLPAYNNNLFARGITRDEYALLINHPDKPLYNRAISGEYPSGSTIKPVWAAAALEEGTINEHTSFLSVGGIRIGEWFFPDWRPGGHGTVDVRRALAESVNTFFYNIGGGSENFTGLGVERMVHYGGLFGLGTQTGIDLAGEASGFLPTKEWKEEVKSERWYIGDTYHLAIGQGDLLVTPLQVAAYTAAIANGGDLFRPHIVKEILTGQEEIAQVVENEPIREGFISRKNINIVREGMRQTVTGGSARSLSALEVAVAGKTGTAQWSTKKPTHAWFTGFAPFDRPELAITIMIEEGGEGSDAAVPIAKDFLAWYFDR